MQCGSKIKIYKKKEDIIKDLFIQWQRREPTRCNSNGLLVNPK
jgi:hypothetical protein